MKNAVYGSFSKVCSSHLFSVWGFRLPPGWRQAEGAQLCPIMVRGTWRLEFKSGARGHLFTLAWRWGCVSYALFSFLPILKVLRLILVYSTFVLYWCCSAESWFYEGKGTVRPAHSNTEGQPELASHCPCPPLWWIPAAGAGAECKPSPAEHQRPIWIQKI